MKIPFFLLITLFIFSCAPQFDETVVSFDNYQLEDGFQLEALVAEPLIEAPVDISFDDKGRLWAIEMAGYMQTIEGIDPKMPVGRILVFEDKDNDGQMDHTTIFLDNLKLVRAIAHVYGGLLYAEPPNLFFTKINNNLTPGTKVLIDSAYAVGGNVEHQPNGLLLNIDNWIYNAKSTKRYRLRNGIWEIESTSFRGQWGITKDAMGRLLFNDNSNQVRGDWVLPNLLNQNPYFTPKMAINTTIVKDQRVYPVQATAVNRGYIKGNLDATGKLIKFTSSCGPVFFEGTGFPSDYQGNVFVCAPEVNLIKRNNVDQYMLRRSGKQVWQNKEFLISSDEAFRPVNLQNGPDGALYIVDMHRGIIQHKTYMTSYLRDLYIKKGLDSIVGMGRILKVSENGQPKHTNIDLTKLTTTALIDSLDSPNIWIRDRAQQLLIQKNENSVTEKLSTLLQTSENEITRIHALYTLEGLNKLKNTQLSIKNQTSFPALCAHLIKLVTEKNIEINTQELSVLLKQKNETIDYYLAYYLSKNPTIENTKLLVQLIEKYQEVDWFLEPVFSGMAGHEKILSNSLNTFKKTTTRIHNILEASAKIDTKGEISQDGLTLGLTLYRNRCASCHGPDGKGIKGLAPPLLQSEYVAGNPSKLAAIMLYGLQGPIKVNGIDYTTMPAMPGIGNDPTLSDEAIKNIGNYIRNAFTTSPQNLKTKTVDSLRTMKRSLDKVYTVKELNENY